MGIVEEKLERDIFDKNIIVEIPPPPAYSALVLQKLPFVLIQSAKGFFLPVGRILFAIAANAAHAARAA